MDMTTGPIVKLLVLFALPLLLGNLFQQLYNTVDSLVVGNFVGTEALAAVGSTTSIINTVVRFFNGVSIGAGVIISRYYGAHDDEKLSLSVATTLAFTLLCSIFFTAFGVAAAPRLLKLMSTPDDVMGPASLYLKIYFSGVAGLLVYNMGSAVLRAVGDTTRPLWFLCFSSVMNICLDLLFVIVFQMGIAGVAYATIISQFVSAVLVFLVILRDKETFHFNFKDLTINGPMVKQILIIGFPAGLQQSLTAFSNVYVQSYVNSFGSSCMAGWSCYTKIDQFIFLPIQSMGQAATTFVSQNVGAKNLKRAKKGTIQGLFMAALVTFSTAALLWTFAPFMVSLFNREPDVVYHGVFFIRLCVFFTVFCCLNQVLSGALRGIGDSKTPMFIMLFSFVLFRQVYLYAATSISRNLYTVGMGYPIGWIMCSVLICLYYFFSGWEKKIHLD